MGTPITVLPRSQYNSVCGVCVYVCMLYSRAKYFTTFRVRFVATVTAVVIAVALCGPADARAVLATKIVGIELQNARLLRPWSVIAVEVTCGWKENGISVGFRSDFCT